jgi:hypothetical protein
MKCNSDPSGWNHSEALQIYDTEGVFLDAPAGFVGGGINSNDVCFVIATDTHLNALERRLESYGIYIPTLIADNRYNPLNAEDTLSRFMKNSWPDEDLFILTISDLLKRARSKSHYWNSFLLLFPLHYSLYPAN